MNVADPASTRIGWSNNPYGLADDYSGTNRFRGFFPDPFFDYAHTQMPRSLYDVLWWAQFLMLTNGTLRRAALRSVQLLLTGVEATGVSADEREKAIEYWQKKLGIMAALAVCGEEYMTYGNSFAYWHVPFRRYLPCSGCGMVRPFEKVGWELRPDGFAFLCRCGRRNGGVPPLDLVAGDDEPPRLMTCNPFLMRIRYNSRTGDREYFSEVDARLKSDIRRRDEFTIRTTPWDWIQCAEQDRLYQFKPGRLFHLFDRTPAGLNDAGWGIPPALAHFRRAWLTAVLSRHTEGVALDHIVPWRVFSPAPNAGPVGVAVPAF